MNKIERLAKAKQFAACYTRGKVHKGRYVVVHARTNNLDISRVGFSVSKKLGKAVVRNKVKRRLREIVRSMSDRMVTGLDIVIAARVASVEAPFNTLNSGVSEVLSRAGVLLPAEAVVTNAQRDTERGGQQ